MIDDQHIRGLLERERPPESADGRERAVEAARHAVRPASRPRRRPLGVAAAVVCATALAALMVTPQGRAVAGDVAGFVGIGDPPTVEDHSYGGFLEPSTRGVVIATGTTPGGAPFEIVGFHSEEGTCLGLDWPRRSNPRGGVGCIDGPQRDPLPLPVSGRSPVRDEPSAALIVSGLAGPDVERVELAYRAPDGSRQSAPVELGTLDGELADRAGTEHPAGFYAAFIPQRHLGARRTPSIYDVSTTIVLTAYDRRGEPLERLEYGAVLARVAQREAGRLAAPRMPGRPPREPVAPPPPQGR